MQKKTSKKEALEGEVLLRSPQDLEAKASRKRKTKYDPKMCDKMIAVAEQGGHIPAILKAIGVRSKDTFYRWLRDYKEFNEAYEASKLASQAFYEEVLLAGALGKIKGYNFNSIAMVMNNKFSDEYKRSATGSNTEVNIGSINSIENLNSEQLDKKIQRLQEKLNLIPESIDDRQSEEGTS